MTDTHETPSLEQILESNHQNRFLKDQLIPSVPRSLDDLLSGDLRKTTILIIGIKGMGFSGKQEGELGSGNNKDFYKLVSSKGGTLLHESEAERAIRQNLREPNAGLFIHLYGYSRGGNAAVDLANEFATRENTKIEITTFDIHTYIKRDLNVNPVVTGQNFYQRNPRTSEGFGGIRFPQDFFPFDGENTNPFTGARLNGANIENYELSEPGVTHNNIVTIAMNKGLV